MKEVQIAMQSSKALRTDPTKRTFIIATLTVMLTSPFSSAQTLNYVMSPDGTVRDASGNIISKPGTRAEAEAAQRKAVLDFYNKTGNEAASCVFQNFGDKYQNTLPVEGDKKSVSYTCPRDSVSDAHAGNHQTDNGTVGISNADKDHADKTGRESTAVNTGDKGGYTTYDPKSKQLTVVGAKDQSAESYISDCDQPTSDSNYTRNGWEETEAYSKGDQNANGHGLACLPGILKLCADATAEAAGLCDEYEIKRNKDRERNAKKQDERDRQAALEAERLRQQQLAEQRQKKTETKKNSDKKPDKTASTKKTPSSENTTSSSTKSSGTKVQTTSSKPASTSPSSVPKVTTKTIDTGLKDAFANEHYCTSFEFVKDQKAGDVMWNKIYKCTKCGKQVSVDVKRGEAIDDVIADNKEKEAFNKQRVNFLRSSGVMDGDGNISVKVPTMSK